MSDPTIRYLIAEQPRHVTDEWASCPQYDTAEAAAAAWLEHPLFPLRVRVAGRVTYGLAEQVAPVYEALARLREAA